MFKFIQRHIDANMIKSAFAFAIIYCLLFNSAVIIYKFEYYQANILTAILELAKDFVYLVITLFVFFFKVSWANHPSGHISLSPNTTDLFNGLTPC